MGNIEGKVGKKSKGKVLRDYNPASYACLDKYDDGRWDWARFDDIPIHNVDLEIVPSSEKTLVVSFESMEIPEDIVHPLDSSYALRHLFSEAKKYVDSVPGGEFVTLGIFGRPVSDGMVVKKVKGRVIAEQTAFLLKRKSFEKKD